MHITLGRSYLATPSRVNHKEIFIIYIENTFRIFFLPFLVFYTFIVYIYLLICNGTNLNLYISVHVQWDQGRLTRTRMTWHLWLKIEIRVWFLLCEGLATRHSSPLLQEENLQRFHLLYWTAHLQFPLSRSKTTSFDW